MVHKIHHLVTLFCFCYEALSVPIYKVLSGYPAGLLADCPGIEREARILKSSRKTLKIVVPYNGSYTESYIRQKEYDYTQMAGLAKVTDFRKKTVIYMTGFFDTPKEPIPSVILYYYRNLGYNAWAFEYVHFNTQSYPVGSRFLPPIGKHFAGMLAELTHYGLNPKKLELIGFNHGAHGISFIAKNYRTLTGQNVSRLTGLSPSGICFRNLGPDQRLDDTDADFVDVVHTNIDGYGMAAPMGHVNFYVNGGEFQASWIDFVTCMAFCSNLAAFRYWIAALLYPNSFIALKCESVQEARDFACFDREPRVTNVMGLNTDRSKPGVYYLSINNGFPYYLGEDGLKKENLNFLKLWSSGALVREL